MKTVKSLRPCLIALCTALLWCGREYNPFSDASNATLYVAHASFKNSDTVGIFCTETLSTLILVKELVDSCVISANDNRRWSGRDTTLVKTDFVREPFAFEFSFYDTGRHVIIMTTYRSNAPKKVDSISCYVTSFLHQDAIACIFGDSIMLRTPPVHDKDINYFWLFGASTRYSSQLCSTRVAFGSIVLSGKGLLWVSDGIHSSPVDSFTFSARDTSKPSIICVNENYVNADTIYTGDSVFNFKVRISAIGDRWVDSASVNAAAFDGKANKVYNALFDKMQLHVKNNPLTLRVFALDHFYQGNISEKSFTIIFSDTVKPAAPARIVVVSPSKDSTHVRYSPFRISGVIENQAFEPLDLSVYAILNSAQQPLVKIIKGTQNSWDWTLPLSFGANTITIMARDNSSRNLVDSAKFTLFFADTAGDMWPPKIEDITLNGKPAVNNYSDKNKVLVGVKVFDEGSGVDSVFIADKRVFAQDSGMWYYDSVTIPHTPSGTEVTIRAKDKKQNDTIASFVVYQNRLPIIQKKPAPAFIALDSLYKDTLEAFDPDNDSVTVDKSQGPQALQVSRQGAIYWVPSRLDTGNHTITLRIFDGIQPVFYSYTVYVYGDFGHPAPVRFRTKTEDFPQFLEVGKDTLRVPLRVSDNSGIRPFVFSARIVNKNQTLLSESSDSTVVWAPTIVDTGFEQLMVVVKDAFPKSDTLYPRILVVAGNRPCSLTINFKSATTSSGAIDLNNKKQKDTLVFHIVDPDNPLIERHDLSILQTRTQMHSIIDSAVVDSFVVVLDPVAFDGFDTMVAVVKDKAGHTDTLRQAVYYGMPPYSPQAQDPLNYASVNGNSITLSWQDVDPDADSLSYDVYVGMGPDMMALRATTSLPSFFLSGLASKRTYYWQVVAKDWKSSASGPVWQFTTR